LQKQVIKVDLNKVCQELLRAMRSKRSQNVVNRKLGYSFNQVSRWESGRKRILWTEFLKFAHVCNSDIQGPVARSFGYLGPLEQTDNLVKHLVGNCKKSEIIESIECSRFQLSRWLAGKQVPTLAHVLGLADLTYRSLPQFLSSFVDIKKIPTLYERYEREVIEKNLIYEHPYTASILHSLSLKSYKSLPKHEEGFLAKYLGISLEAERTAIKELKRIRRIRRKRGLYVAEEKTFDISGNFDGGRRIRMYWAEESRKFLASLREAPQRSLGGINVFSLSDQALQKISEKYFVFFQDVRQIIELDKNPASDVWILSLNLFTPSERNH